MALVLKAINFFLVGITVEVRAREAVGITRGCDELHNHTIFCEYSEDLVVKL